jgi:UDP-N-acetylmuramoylalanine--D-glutamate ligase
MTVSPTSALILGFAREGASLARFLAERGTRVTVTDIAPADQLSQRIDELSGLPVSFSLGAHHQELVNDVDAFYVSPGVPESNPVYQAARNAGHQIESMTTLFFDLCPAPIVGITGSSGKTTTTGLIGHILREADIDVAVGGNIGDPMIDLLPRITSTSVVVLELSSFQLDLLRTSPHIAVVTNITPNHLDRHGSMDAYIAAKSHILEHQTERDFAVLNCHGSELKHMAQRTRAQKRWFNISGPFDGAGACMQGQALHLLRAPGEKVGRERVIGIEEVPLIGPHNLENVLAAMAVTDILGVHPDDMASAIKTFKPAPHRLQTVGVHNGVTYIDDSIATSPARAVVALQALIQPVVLIAGGRDKNLPWEEFAYWASIHTHALLLIGEAAALIESAVVTRLGHNSQLKPTMIRRCDTLQSAVALAAQLARPGDIVLLSPGCTSYDMFTDFHERGIAFSRTVEALNAA